MDHHETLDRFFPAMFNQDSETLAELLAEDVRWLVPPSVAERFGEVQGRKKVLDFLTAAGGDFFEPGSFRLDPHMKVVEGDCAAVIAHMRGQTASGQPYQNEYAFSFRFQGEQICEVRELLDTAQFQSYFP